MMGNHRIAMQRCYDFSPLDIIMYVKRKPRRIIRRCTRTHPHTHTPLSQVDNVCAATSVDSAIDADRLRYVIGHENVTVSIGERTQSERNFLWLRTPIPNKRVR